MNKEQIKKALEELRDDASSIYMNADDGSYEEIYHDGYLNACTSAIELIQDHLDEPGKVIIPQFVADWWELDGDSVNLYGEGRVKKKHKFDLVSDFHDTGLDGYLSKVEDWIYKNNSIFFDLVNGKPYEVEKEKLYYVIDKSRKPLLKAFKEEVSMSVCNVTVEEAEALEYPNFKYKLTEKEIKDYDLRYWQFAEPVEEEEK